MRRAALGGPLALHREARDLISSACATRRSRRALPFEPERQDNRHRLNMGVFPQGAEIIPNPYNKISGLRVRVGEGGVYFVPGFPVMAWPMIEWVLDTQVRASASRRRRLERSVIVFGPMEGALTPLMETIEGEFPGVKVFSLPSVDDPRAGSPHRAGRQGRRRARSMRPMHACRRAGGARRRLGPELVR